MTEKHATLGETCCFSNLSPSLLRLAGEVEHHVAFAPGEVIFCEREPGNDAYVILSGEVDLIANTPSGPLTVATLGANHSVGELGLFCDLPRLCTAQARSHVDALYLTRDTIDTLMARYPQMATTIIISLSKRLGAALDALRTSLISARISSDAIAHALPPTIFASW